jgi:hypothetical protein
MARKDPEQLRTALDAFESALHSALVEEAQRSVDETIERLVSRVGPLRVKDVQVDVVIKNLTFETGNGARERSSKRTAPKRRSATSRRQSAGARGRPAGRVRLALLGAFTENPDAQLDTEALRLHLKVQGLEPTTDNLHQHLGRLVRAGALTRPSRGLYRLGADAS